MKAMTMTVIVLLLGLITGGLLYTPNESRAELEARYANVPTDFALVGVRSCL